MFSHLSHVYFLFIYNKPNTAVGTKSFCIAVLVLPESKRDFRTNKHSEISYFTENRRGRVGVRSADLTKLGLVRARTSNTVLHLQLHASQFMKIMIQYIEGSDSGYDGVNVKSEKIF